MGTYRDEREATLAQNASLQKDKAALEKTVETLRQENLDLKRRNASLASGAGASEPSKRRPRFVFAAVAALVGLVAIGALWATVSAPSPTPPPTTPSLVPSSAPSPSPMPSISSPPSTSSTPVPSAAPMPTS